MQAAVPRGREDSKEDDKGRQAGLHERPGKYSKETVNRGEQGQVYKIVDKQERPLITEEEQDARWAELFTKKKTTTKTKTQKTQGKKGDLSPLFGPINFVLQTVLTSCNFGVFISNLCLFKSFFFCIHY